MTSLYRVRTSLSGFQGAPGTNALYFLAMTGVVDDVRLLWANIATLMPDDVKIQVEGFGDVIESTTGALTGGWVGSQPLPSVGTAVGDYAAPVGMLLRWSTDTVLGGHRVRGRTFAVPAAAGNFDTFGQVDSTSIVGIQAAISAFVLAQAGNFVIWHRPREATVATPTRPARPAAAGGHAVVTGSGVSTKAVVLRSRRD